MAAGMSERSGVELLGLPVRLHGLQLGQPSDLLLDRETMRAVGIDVVCGDEAHRFLPFATAAISDDAITITSPLVLLEVDELAFYRSRSFTLRSLRGRPVARIYGDADAEHEEQHSGDQQDRPGQPLPRPRRRGGLGRRQADQRGHRLDDPGVDREAQVHAH